MTENMNNEKQVKGRRTDACHRQPGGTFLNEKTHYKAAKQLTLKMSIAAERRFSTYFVALSWNGHTYIYIWSLIGM